MPQCPIFHFFRAPFGLPPASSPFQGPFFCILHDPSEPYWTAKHVRRYAYWSVLTGACGHTYGDNALDTHHYIGKDMWWMSPVTGIKSYIGKCNSDTFTAKKFAKVKGEDTDRVLLIK